MNESVDSSLPRTPVLASPRARVTARRARVRLEDIQGSGPGGRVLYDDVMSHLASLQADSGDPGHVDESHAPAADQAAAELVEPPAPANLGEVDGVVVDDDVESAVTIDDGDEFVREVFLDDHPDGFDDDLVASTDDTDDDPAGMADDPVENEPAEDAGDDTGDDDPAGMAGDDPVAGTDDSDDTSDDDRLVPSTAPARSLAELLGIDINEVPTTDPIGWVTRDDVASWVRNQLDEPTTSEPGPSSQPDVPPTSESALGAQPDVPPNPQPASDVTSTSALQPPSAVVPFDGNRGLIAAQVHRSLHDMAQATLSIDADMRAVNAERDRRKQQQQPVPGYTAWAVAAASRALVDHPRVNSQITPEGLALLPEIHVGVAVALADGFVVPVIRNANRASIDELHEIVAADAARARAGQLEPTDLDGCTFSVTALGMHGIDVFTPIVHPPNTAILGVGRLRTETSWDSGLPTPRTVMTLSLSWDHRAYDGAPAAEFAQTVVRYLEYPELLDT